MSRPVPVKLIVFLAVAAAFALAVLNSMRDGSQKDQDPGGAAGVQQWLDQRLARAPMPAPKSGQPEVLLLWRAREDAAKVKDFVQLVDHPDGLNGVYGMDVASTDKLAPIVHFTDLMGTRPVPGAWLMVLDSEGHPVVSTPLLTRDNIEKAFRRARGERVSLEGASDPYLDQMAPDFVTTTQGGKKFHLADHFGHRIVLTFYCGCVYCQEQARYLGMLQKHSELSDVEWLSVTHMTPERTKAFMNDMSQTFTPLNEVNSSSNGIAHVYDSLTCPRVWYIAPSGKVEYYNYTREPAQQVVISLARALQADQPRSNRPVRA